MKKSYRLFALTALFALGVAGWSGVGSTAQEKLKGGKGGTEKELSNEKELNKKLRPVPPPIPKWEYKVTAFERDDQAAEQELNKLGDEGWELVGTPTRTSGGGGPGGGGGIRSKVSLVFKRPKR